MRSRIAPSLKLDSLEFQEAALARVVEYCMAFGDKPFPETVTSLKHLLDEQRAAEVPPGAKTGCPASWCP